MAKEGKDKKVVFEAGFTKGNCKPKWFLRKDEVFESKKYKMKTDGESYSLIIYNPKVEDSGKYTIEINGVQCFAFLNVEEADPTYSFTKELKKKINGYLRHETVLEAQVSSNLAIIGWYKGDKKLEEGDKYQMMKDLNGNLMLTIKNCEDDDSGDYACVIERQPDNNRTETKVKISEYQYKFVKVLKSQALVEKDTVTLACELDDELGEVKWFKGEEEIKPDKRVQIVSDGRKRKLVIKDAKVTDAAGYACVSNADRTEAEIVINYQNRFNKKLKDTTAIEREKLVLEVELQDQTAAAEWKFNGQPIEPNDRIEIKNLGGGKHQLIFNKLEMTDDGQITCESGKLQSAMQLTVQKGESKPIIDFPNEAEGPISAPIVLEVPYKSKYF